MVFSSPFFLFYFLPVTLLLTYLFRHYKLRNTVLLLLSVFFYIFGEGELILVMFGSITLNYFFGRWVGKSKTKTSIGVSVAVNLLLLIIYKYTGFIVENINPLIAAITGSPLKPVHIKLPVGISFYTFHAISYLIDVYRGKNEPQKSYIDLALYICLFPQLVAGPIIRYKDVAHQFAGRIISTPLFQRGVERFIIGLGKKVILANSLGYVVDQVFKLNPLDLTMASSWFGIICYSMQLYFDFSGYSDMAIGLGKMLGFTFLENFRFPYKAQSIREFWQRWHISLSNWFRDYLYIPLGGNRVGPGRVYLNLFIVFFLTGLWHGANWNFVIWGMLHGLFMVVERIGFEKMLAKLPGIFQHLYALFVVVIAWVFFRTQNLTEATGFLKSMFALGTSHVNTLDMFLNKEAILAFVLGLIMAFDGFNFMLRRMVRFLYLTSISRNLVKTTLRNSRAVFLLLIFLYSAIIIAAGSYNPFIYFRF